MKLIDRTETVVIKDVPTPVRITQWDFSEEIAQGSALLDRLVPGWYKDLDLERLDLESGSNCVLGQLAMTKFRDELLSKAQNYDDDGGRCGCGCRDNDERTFDYADVTSLLAQVEGDTAWQAHSLGNPATHGFFVSDEGRDKALEGYDYDERESLSRLSWEQLTHAWMDEIWVRRRADKRQAEAAILDALASELSTSNQEVVPA